MNDNILGLLLGVFLFVIFFLFLKLFIIVKDVMKALALELRFMEYFWNSFIDFFKKDDK